jgi:hypothetical protein
MSIIEVSQSLARQKQPAVGSGQLTVIYNDIKTSVYGLFIMRRSRL